MKFRKDQQDKGIPHKREDHQDNHIGKLVTEKIKLKRTQKSFKSEPKVKQL
jgi:hypothetical protein